MSAADSTSLFNQIAHTAAMRPYVIAFFASWLILSLRHLGARATFTWLIAGYAIALASEATSIRTGFPYGWYFYQYEHLQNELLLFGVPVWDSLSYVFLSYAGFAFALTLLKNRVNFLPSSAKSHLALSLAGGTATTFLDILIDPVAHQGEKWFLGDIYYYPHPGWYFDVPLSNFAGWFLVSTAIIWTVLSLSPAPCKLWNLTPLRLGSAFYLAIGLFNTAIAFAIGDFFLGTVNFLYLIAIATALAWNYRLSKPPNGV